MKFRAGTAIQDTASGVAFFSSCLDEILYEYTPATYKPRVMTVPALVAEALNVTKKVESGSIDRARIQPILDELHFGLSEDPVAKGLLDFPSDYYTAFNKDVRLSELTVRLGLLRNRLRTRRYVASLQSEIIRLCENDKNKEEIHYAAQRWVSALLSLGYSVQFISHCVNEQFYGQVVIYSDSLGLKRFFELFPFEHHSFEVIFAASSIIKETIGVSKEFSWSLLGDDDPRVARAVQAGLVVGNSEVMVVMSEVAARDIYSAKFNAEKRLEHLSDLFALFHHKRKIQWQSCAVVKTIDDDFNFVQSRMSSVKRSRDNLPRKASQKLAAAVGGLSFSDRDSMGRFISVVRLHGSAQEATGAQAQIVNLWTAMEVLVPRESDSKLRGVLNLIMPFLAHGYFNRLLYSLAGDFYRWNSKGTSRILKATSLEGWSQHQKLSAVLLGGQFEPLRDDLYSLASGYPLLMNRCFKLSVLISKTDHLDERIKLHERRVAW